ncbi:SET domain-containing protein-lysine N-methyltransferase [bacterium]|nr:SET domain-containing protein-lysine N-methyltransferase [bacterium]
MLNPKVELKQSVIQGMGIFAKEFIKEGEIVWWETPEEQAKRFIVTREVVASWPEELQRKFLNYAYQISEGIYYGPENGVSNDPADSTNHSCDPNTWFVDDNAMSARRDIMPGEEITYDYAMSEIEEDFILVCGCGAANCRGIIRGSDHLLLEVQEAYGSHMMQHTLQSIAAQGKASKKVNVASAE